MYVCIWYHFVNIFIKNFVFIFRIFFWHVFLSYIQNFEICVSFLLVRCNQMKCLCCLLLCNTLNTSCLVLSLHLYQRYCFFLMAVIVLMVPFLCNGAYYHVCLLMVLSKFINKHCCLMGTNITNKQTLLALVSWGLC